MTSKADSYNHDLYKISSLIISISTYRKLYRRGLGSEGGRYIKSVPSTTNVHVGARGMAG